jgi:hypothetical protein
MPDASTQTLIHNRRILQGRKKNFFDCEERQRFNNIDKIKQLLQESDLNKFCNKIGLKVSEIKLTPNDDNVREIPTKVMILPFNVSDDTKVFRWMVAKDVANMSFRKYRLIRKSLKTIYFEKIPGWKKVFNKQHEINDFFRLEEPNRKGFFYEPYKKIQFVCEKFLQSDQEFRDSGERTFKIKLSADSMNLSKKHLILLNFTFSLLNDKRNAMSVFGTFILGKHYERFRRFFNLRK